MYELESMDNGIPVLRDTRNLTRLDRYDERVAGPASNDITHECSKCRATMTIGTTEAKDMPCYACNDYRLFIPLTYSPLRRWRAVTAYRLRNAWRSIKREVREVWQ